MSLAFSNPHCSSLPTAISTVLLVTHQVHLQSAVFFPSCLLTFSVFHVFNLSSSWGTSENSWSMHSQVGPWIFRNLHQLRLLEHTHAHTHTFMHKPTCTHTPSAINREDRISQVSVACHQWMRAPSLSWKFLELITDGFWTMREKAWHEGSCDPSHSDDLAASLDPELAPAVRASGKYLCHEDKATHASCCLLAYPHPIYSGSSVKQMFQPYICKCFWL